MMIREDEHSETTRLLRRPVLTLCDERLLKPYTVEN